MVSPAVEDFNQTFARSPDFRLQISQTESVPQLLAILQTWGCPLTGPEIIGLAQQAYQTWLATLSPAVQAFFVEAHENKILNQAIETCKTPADAIALAQTHGFQISEADLHAAAESANTIEGFSFEKLWFRSLGLLENDKL
jgi:predicted ribosomally synthesized peptide with nif11-like leader